MGTQLATYPAANPTGGTILEVTPEGAGWEYISFAVWQLEQGQEVHGSTGGEEVGLVVLSGKLSLRSSAAEWKGIGERRNVFDGKPYVVYLPPGVSYEVTAETACEVARAGARAERGAEARLITPDQITVDQRGHGNAERTIRHVLEGDQPAESLFLVEVLTPSGNWSSYPPHKHDVNDPPQETYLEETYYHRIRPEQGFGFQRVYTRDGGLDEAIVIRDGTLVMVPRGYHPTVIAPGYELYYLNVMAGPVRQWIFNNDPDHAWVLDSWQR